MDDLNAKISEILNNPESLEQLKSVAENIFSGENSSVLPSLFIMEISFAFILFSFFSIFRHMKPNPPN